MRDFLLECGDLSGENARSVRFRLDAIDLSPQSGTSQLQDTLLGASGDVAITAFLARAGSYPVSQVSVDALEGASGLGQGQI